MARTHGIGGLPLLVAISAIVTAIGGCSPLPGRTIDPVYGRFIPKADSDSSARAAPEVEPAPKAPAVSPGPARPQAPAAPAAPATERPSPPRVPSMSQAPPVSQAPPALQTPPPVSRQEARAAARGPVEWTGRYVDSRGSGVIVLSLTRTEGGLAGTWSLRTGGGGAFRGVVGADGRVAFRMDSTESACAATLEGWAEVRETTLVGAYHGQDCEGVISNGRIDAQRK